MNYLDYKDLLVTPILLIIIYSVTYLIKNSSGNVQINKYLIPGLTVKIFGAVFSVLIYEFYYGGGDMTIYFKDGTTMFNILRTDPIAGIKLLYQPAKHIDSDTFQYTPYLHYWDQAGGYLVGKFVAIFSILTFNTYTSVAVLFALLSFTGIWAMYITLIKIYPALDREFAIAVLFIPSVFFWGSGILKDTVTLGCLGWLTYACYHLFIIRSRIFLSIGLILLTGWLILSIKGYIVLAFIPGLVFWIFLTYTSRLTNDFVRFIIKPLIFAVSFLIGILLMNSVGASLTRFSTGNFVEIAETYQFSHTNWEGADEGSTYTLGEFSPTTLGLIRVFPAAVNVTFFRPYLWEVKNPVMLLAALESLALFIFFLYVLIKAGPLRFFAEFYNNPLVFFCMIFSILFAFAVGFSAYNFGNLVRYKIPCVPFFTIGLFVIYHETIRKRKVNPTIDENI